MKRLKYIKLFENFASNDSNPAVAINLKENKDGELYLMGSFYAVRRTDTPLGNPDLIEGSDRKTRTPEEREMSKLAEYARKEFSSLFVDKRNLGLTRHYIDKMNELLEDSMSDDLGFVSYEFPRDENSVMPKGKVKQTGDNIIYHILYVYDRDDVDFLVDMTKRYLEETQDYDLG